MPIKCQCKNMKISCLASCSIDANDRFWALEDLWLDPTVIPYAFLNNNNDALQNRFTHCAVMY